MLTICEGDNLPTLQRLAAAGEKFDLIELDGPYGAGLEAWDNLTPDEYLAHYTARLGLVRQVLQPWGVVFVFGYPEGCAEIKAWARQTGTLHMRRWLTWYKQRTAHKGRKVETILMLVHGASPALIIDFKDWLRQRRQSMGLTIGRAMAVTPCRVHLAGKGAGAVWFEAESAGVPTADEYAELKQVFNVPDRFDQLCTLGSYDNLTDLDFLNATYPEDTRALNGAGLRSKPIGLYHDLFRPVVPPRAERRALVLYGGSGNAAIAAGQLGYDVTCCEQDAARCAAIRQAWAAKVERRDVSDFTTAGPLFALLNGAA